MDNWINDYKVSGYHGSRREVNIAGAVVMLLPVTELYVLTV